MATKKLPARSKVKAEDTWDLASLFASDAEWETAFTKWQKQIKKYEAFRGTLSDSPEQLAKCLKFDSKFDRQGERIGTYAFLKTAEDATNSDYQRMVGRYQNVGSEAAQAASFIRPEVLSLSAAKLKKYLASKPLAHFRLMLDRLTRYKPHTLTDGEEKLLAMQLEMAGAANEAFSQLTDSDMKFGEMKNEKGETIELGHSSYSAFLNSPKRAVRKQSFHQYHKVYAEHENTLAATLRGSIQRDVYYARARNFPSAREASLFNDNVPVAVYDNLIEAVHSKLPAVHRYLDVRRRKMKLKEIHQYDTYVPVLSELNVRTTWNKAVKQVVEALKPLGDDYCRVLADGMEKKTVVRSVSEQRQTERRL